MGIHSSAQIEIEIEGIKLHQKQLDVIKHPARFKVVSCGRRFGKTLLAIEWLVFEEGGAIDGNPVAFFSPSYKYLSDVWKDIEETVRPIISKANKSEMRIELITGGNIDFWTLEDKSAGRGRRYKKIVVDEAAHARNLKDIWEQSIAPTLTDYRGEACFLSTPLGMNYFYDLYQKGKLDNNEWASFHAPSSDNPHIAPEEIDRARADLPELVYAQEYLAQFVTFGAGLIKPEMLVEGTAPAGLPVVLGVDLAISEKAGADWTAIVAMSRDPKTGIVYVRECERHRVGFHAVLERIQAAAARWSPSLVAIEQVQYQAAVVQELARTTKLPVRGIRPDKDKLTRFMPLLTRFEQGLVRVDPAGFPAWAREELLAMPEGQHDDVVDALSLSYTALGSQDRPTLVSAGARQAGTYTHGYR